MMKNMPNMGDFPDMGSDMPNFDNMSQDEMAAASKDAISAVKEALDSGDMTRQDVLEFEKMIGMDVSAMVKMMDSNQIDKRKLRELSPDMVDMVDLFKKLAALKTT